ncbi:putative exosortase-associated protein, TIGR04073 family [Verrucomicrobium sp. GAS474]|uniref:hypothetical protein n=1 Tax=Verrucomicrobium sp. GAS474 TaxID=1882831 RepID=UPI00087A1C9B|nr:hypothetical protein [Verrucomicrobium sp. GAS474]SDT97598.1 putative exosortase-associated protein, TIGR04073 family [Verrucomicrobium sp. GAS474]
MRSSTVAPALLGTLLLLGLISAPLRADISMPKKETLYDKVGRGFANIALAPTEILDSMFTLNELEGPTVAWTKGLVQGTGRTVSDIGLGVVDLATGPLPVGPGASYRTLKQHPADSMIVNPYPPGDLVNFY